jgi:hypothetical protein
MNLIIEIFRNGVDILNLSYYIPIIVLFIILFILLRNRKAIIAKKAIKKRKTEDKTKMLELAKRFIDKECLIYAFDSNHQFQGTIKEVTDGAILLDNNGKLEAINLDFVIRIREYPTNKKGKKKSVVID